MSSSTTSVSSPSPDAEARLAAIQRRTVSGQVAPVQSAAQKMQEHEKKQEFRRMINPGITRPNNDAQAFASMKILQTIANNLLREPENPKFQRFKPTNSVIKRDLIDPKGALEYAIALGFRPEVENFQPYYVFNPRKLADLRIGAEILEEHMKLETERRERMTRNKVDAKAEAAAIAAKVKLQFIEDRTTKEELDRREKVAREARAAAAALRETASPVNGAEPAENPEPAPKRKTRRMPGSGHLLTDPEGMSVVDVDEEGSEEEEEEDGAQQEPPSYREAQQRANQDSD